MPFDQASVDRCFFCSNDVQCVNPEKCSRLMEQRRKNAVARSVEDAENAPSSVTDYFDIVRSRPRNRAYA